MVSYCRLLARLCISSTLSLLPARPLSVFVFVFPSFLCYLRSLCHKYCTIYILASCAIITVASCLEILFPFGLLLPTASSLALLVFRICLGSFHTARSSTLTVYSELSCLSTATGPPLISAPLLTLPLPDLPSRPPRLPLPDGEPRLAGQPVDHLRVPRLHPPVVLLYPIGGGSVGPLYPAPPTPRGLYIPEFQLRRTSSPFPSIALLMHLPAPCSLFLTFLSNGCFVAVPTTALLSVAVSSAGVMVRTPWR